MLKPLFAIALVLSLLVTSPQRRTFSRTYQPAFTEEEVDQAVARIKGLDVLDLNPIKKDIAALKSTLGSPQVSFEQGRITALSLLVDRLQAEVQAQKEDIRFLSKRIEALEDASDKKK